MSRLLDLVTAMDTRWLLVTLLAALDIWSIGLIVRSAAPRRDKLWWGGIVILCPIIGCLFWYVLGPKPDLRNSV